VKAESEGSVQREPRTCPVCGTKFFATADREFCPVCILHRAFGAESAATEESGSTSELAASAEESDGGSQVRRFENYEVMLDTDGRPIELGRGAMGITYKALDVDLRCPVTLKVISERCPAIVRSDILARSCFASVANIEIITSLNGPVESSHCS
jgi:hypothetical protein